jgi:hypothetical protein
LSYVDPLLPLALAFAIISLFLAWRSSKKRSWMLASSVACLLIISSRLVAAFFSKTLEARYDGRPFVDNGEAIVVLAGGCNPAGRTRNSNPTPNVHSKPRQVFRPNAKPARTPATMRLGQPVLPKLEVRHSLS